MYAGSEIENSTPSAEFVDLAAEVFSILSDPTRIRIVLALHHSGELPVSSIAEIVKKSPSGASQHLARLRLARMVTTRQDGTKVLYRLVDEHASALVYEAIKQAEHSIANGAIPPHHHSA